MAIFLEDYEIKVSRLIKLWVAEGFLKSATDKTLEKVAEEYLKELIDRNISMVEKQSTCRTGKIKTCKIHDMLWDLCLSEAQKERFLYITQLREDIKESIKSEHLHGFHQDTSCQTYRHPELRLASRSSMPLARTLVCRFKWESPDDILCFNLLPVLDVVDKYMLVDIQQLVNSRYLSFSLLWDRNWKSRFTSSVSSMLWNLETIIVDVENVVDILPSEIWEMQHLRHLVFRGGMYLSDPDRENSCVLNNLQTLFVIYDMRKTGEVLGKIPNLKKLVLQYNNVPEEVTDFINNLVHLHRLETLSCKLGCYTSLNTLDFQLSLRKLDLSGPMILWEIMGILSSMPNLEVLILGVSAFCGPEWNTEEEFQSLKYLSISYVDLKIWTAESSNFPILEHLFLQIDGLEDIPWGIGEIATLQSIKLRNCKNSVVKLAHRILEEQQSQGNDDLKINASTWDYEELKTLANCNFEVEHIAS